MLCKDTDLHCMEVTPFVQNDNRTHLYVGLQHRKCLLWLHMHLAAMAASALLQKVLHQAAGKRT
jgi:hypothetical protein